MPTVYLGTKGQIGTQHADSVQHTPKEVTGLCVKVSPAAPILQSLNFNMNFIKICQCQSFQCENSTTTTLITFNVNSMKVHIERD